MSDELTKDEKLRLKCLELLVGKSEVRDAYRQPENFTKSAGKFYDFVKGKSDSEIVEAANEFTSKVTQLQKD